MRERVQEMRAAARKGANAVDGDAAVRAKLAEMPELDRSLGRKIHEIVRATAPTLTPRLWYGMPAYSRDADVVCWFQPASKFKARYATFSFSDNASLDDGLLWPVSFAVRELSPAVEARLTALVKQAIQNAPT